MPQGPPVAAAPHSLDPVDDTELLALPRSVLLALWLEGAGPGREHVRRAAHSIQSDDEPHAVEGAEGVVTDGSTLEELLAAWSGRGTHAAALLPVPGDVSGLPPVVADLAVDAGECVLVAAGPQSWAAVPEIVQFGSVHEVGHLVTWHVRAIPDWRLRLPGVVGTLSEAEQALRRALVSATEALVGLDIARWRPDAAASIASLRSDADPGWALPSGLAPRALRVLASAIRLRAIVEVATADDGGAINLWQADQRSAALREVDHAARRAVAAATADSRPHRGSADEADQRSTDR